MFKQERRFIMSFESKERKRKEYHDKIRRMFIGRDETAIRELGSESEDRFRAMVERLSADGKVPWLLGIAKSSVYEDWCKQIDFWIRVTYKSGDGSMEFSIPFQIKSSYAATLEFKRKHPDSKVHVVAMNDRMNPDWLLHMLRKAYEKEVARRKSS